MLEGKRPVRMFYINNFRFSGVKGLLWYSSLTYV